MTNLTATEWRGLFLEVGAKWSALLERYDLAEDAQPDDVIAAIRNEQRCPHCGGENDTHHES